MSRILDIKSVPAYDNSINKFEYHSYSPFLKAFNNSDEIRIAIQHQDLCILPNESYIYIEGTLRKKANGTVSATAKLVNNAIAFLFDEIRYELNGVEIDRTRNVGTSTTIKNFLSLSENESKMLYNSGWSPVEPTIPVNGNFNFCLPLKNLLGFFEDYKKIIVNAKHELILIRARSDENTYILADDDDVVLNIIKLQWRIPHITVADEEKLPLLKVIESNQPLQISFRSWDMYEYPTLPNATAHSWTVKTSTQLEKPRYVILALQTNRKYQKNKDVTIFDHCEVTDVKIHLNSESYPYDDLNTNFNHDHYALLYDVYSKFQQSYYERQSNPLLSREQFKSVAPIIVIDCSHQNESIKTGPVDIRIELKTNRNIPANTSMYCLLLHDRIVEYNPLTSEVHKVT